MRNQFGKQMDELNIQLIRMGAICKETIAGVTKSLFEGNVMLAREKKQKAGGHCRTYHLTEWQSDK